MFISIGVLTNTDANPSSVKITDTKFTDNTGKLGISFTSSAKIQLITERCTITNNDMQFMFITHADYYDINSTFISNVAHTHITWATFFEIN